MNKIKYNISAFWISPVVPYLLEKEVYEAALEDVKDCQSRLTGELSTLDLSTNAGHEKLISFVNVSNQLRAFKHDVELKIKFFMQPLEPMVGTSKVYTAPMGHK